MFNWLTADGYFAAPDGSLDWVVPDEAQAKVAAADILNFDTVLFGRRSQGTSASLFRWLRPRDFVAGRDRSWPLQ